MNATIKLCSVPDCNKKTIARGFCDAHYKRFQRHGDPLVGRTPEGEPLKFLEDAVKNPDPDACVIWTFGTFSNGYGSARKDGKTMKAHRLALIMFTGTNHPHLEAAHGECHDRLCVNPLHLRWATAKENNADRKRDGTHNMGERNGRAKLTEPEVLAILQDPRRHREIAADFGVSRRLICSIKAGKAWAHLTANVS